jgi:biopolymer transport protein ExbD
VDVSLVLLIIFMVTATFIKGTGMDIRLPSSSAAHVSPQTKRELVIGIDAGGRFLWDGSPVEDTQLAGLSEKDALENGTESRITIRGDSRAEHGRVVRAMTLAQEAGFRHLVIAVRQEAGRDERH